MERAFTRLVLEKDWRRLNYPAMVRRVRQALSCEICGVRGSVFVLVLLDKVLEYGPKRFDSLKTRVTVWHEGLSIDAMVLVQFDPTLLGTLKDRVVVLTGGATGIGR